MSPLLSVLYFHLLNQVRKFGPASKGHKRTCPWAVKPFLFSLYPNFLQSRSHCENVCPLCIPPSQNALLSCHLFPSRLPCLLSIAIFPPGGVTEITVYGRCYECEDFMYMGSLRTQMIPDWQVGALFRVVCVTWRTQDERSDGIDWSEGCCIIVNRN